MNLLGQSTLTGKENEKGRGKKRKRKRKNKELCSQTHSLKEHICSSQWIDFLKTARTWMVSYGASTYCLKAFANDEGLLLQQNQHGQLRLPTAK